MRKMATDEVLTRKQPKWPSSVFFLNHYFKHRHPVNHGRKCKKKYHCMFNACFLQMLMYVLETVQFTGALVKVTVYFVIQFTLLLKRSKKFFLNRSVTWSVCDQIRCIHPEVIMLIDLVIIINTKKAPCQIDSDEKQWREFFFIFFPNNNGKLT